MDVCSDIPGWSAVNFLGDAVSCESSRVYCLTTPGAQENCCKCKEECCGKCGEDWEDWDVKTCGSRFDNPAFFVSSSDEEEDSGGSSGGGGGGGGVVWHDYNDDEILHCYCTRNPYSYETHNYDTFGSVTFSRSCTSDFHDCYECCNDSFSIVSLGIMAGVLGLIALLLLCVWCRKQKKFLSPATKTDFPIVEDDDNVSLSSTI